MFSALSAGVLLLRSMTRSMSSRMTKFSTSLIAGYSGASPKRSRAPTTKLDDTGLPTSVSCITTPDQATRAPRWKIGIARMPSLACSAPHHGSLVKNMSPGRMLSAGQACSTRCTNPSRVDPWCMMYTPVYSPRPSAVISAELKS